MENNTNLAIYNTVRSVPESAKKPIPAGRMKGKTDINPMWRIKVLTEMFGPVGFGWYYDITKEWLEPGTNGEVSAFVEIALYVKYGEEWSKPIIGIGGNAFIANERNGLYTSDECYKMALTDAISVACKALGVGADVYWDSDGTKYSAPEEPVRQPQEPQSYKCCECGKDFEGFTDKNGRTWSAAQVFHMAESSNTDGKARCRECSVKLGTRKVKENA